MGNLETICSTPIQGNTIDDEIIKNNNVTVVKFIQETHLIQGYNN